jgi:hypothetical protein
MKNYLRPSIVILSIGIFLLSPMAAGDAGTPPGRLWNPVPDDVYLQEVSRKIPLDNPVTSVGIYENQCYAVMEGKVYLLSGDGVDPVAAGPARIRRLKSLSVDLWALSTEGIYRLCDGEWHKMDGREFVDVCLHLGVVHAATREEVDRLENGSFKDIKPEGGYLSSNTTLLMEDGCRVIM